jgi:16S rRNA (guanine527-N7)-methyltransferase
VSELSGGGRGDLNRSTDVDHSRYPNVSSDGAWRIRIVLEEARRYGFLGPGPLSVHIGHARGFLRAAAKYSDRLADPLRSGHGDISVADLGSGGGVPSLVNALELPEAAFHLVESNRTRARFLENAIRFLGFGDRVQVDTRRAEEVGHDSGFRHRFDLVTARGFGPPAATAECAAGLLKPGGVAVISEPPEEQANRTMRWSPDGLTQLGYSPANFEKSRHGFCVLVSESPCQDRFPRRVGVPFKRPLY